MPCIKTPSSHEHAGSGKFWYSLVCKEFPILTIVWELKVFQVFTVFVVFCHFCALLSLFLFSFSICLRLSLPWLFLLCLLFMLRGCCCSFFYLRHYFSSSVFNSFACILCWCCPFHSSSSLSSSWCDDAIFFGCDTEYLLELCVPLFCLTWRIHHSDHFIHNEILFDALSLSLSVALSLQLIRSFGVWKPNCASEYSISRARPMYTILSFSMGVCGMAPARSLLFSFSTWRLAMRCDSLSLSPFFLSLCFCVAWNGWYDCKCNE